MPVPRFRIRTLMVVVAATGTALALVPFEALMVTLLVAEGVILFAMIVCGIWVPRRFARFFLWLFAAGVACCAFLLADVLLVAVVVGWK